MTPAQTDEGLTASEKWHTNDIYAENIAKLIYKKSCGDREWAEKCTELLNTISATHRWYTRPDDVGEDFQINVYYGPEHPDYERGNWK